MSLNRRAFIESVSAFGLGGTLLPGTLYAQAQFDDELTTSTIAAAERLAGLSFTEEQRVLMLDDLKERLEAYEGLREVELPNDVIPALLFDPLLGAPVPPIPASESEGRPWEPRHQPRPRDEEALAFLTVAELSDLLRRREVTSVELTELYLRRLKRYDGVLQAVITLTEERARRQAAQADAELDAGRWRGPLHGIPWGAKDLLAVEGYPTTWGAMPYRDQQLAATAAVVERLDAAGAVLVAKLSLGALAWGDVWFGGTTKNPWNVEQGSSGSSAGPGSAVAAGLVGFAIGSETLGSIVSPSTRNGVTGHRPTFGRVSRHGAMTLSWSMDKLGPMARSAEDCALVFAAIHGVDPRDPTTRSAPFAWPGPDVRGLRVGVLANAFDQDYANREADRAALDVVRGLGVGLTPIALPDLPLDGMLLTLEAEAAAAFDELTRTGGTDEMVRQERYAWPNVFRHARFIPAVEYINANRARTRLIQAMEETLADLDAFISPTFGGSTLRITNLTGHPSVTVPNAFHVVDDAPVAARRQPGSITFVGNLYRDDAALALAAAYQGATRWHRERPPIR